MQNDVSIRQISTDADLAFVKQIRRQVFVEEQDIPLHLDEDGLDEEAIHVLISSSDKPLATARMSVNHNEGVIARVAVLPSFRGQGHGKTLVEELIKIAKQKKLKRLELHPHQHLEKFYTDMGFSTIAGKTEVVGEHLLITMEKTLSS
jgi:predicted GNAT family N-acyltransferase